MRDSSESFRKAQALRFPVWSDPQPGAGQKIQELEDHLMLGAYYDGELCTERHECYVALAVAQHGWHHLEGWEPLRQGKTDASIALAKRTLRPDLFDAMEQEKWWIRRLSEEIDRIERDYSKASRLYTMLTGG